MPKLLFKYMKRLTFESIKSDISNLSQPTNGQIELLELSGIEIGLVYPCIQRSYSHK